MVLAGQILLEALWVTVPCLFQFLVLFWGHISLYLPCIRTPVITLRARLDIPG